MMFRAFIFLKEIIFRQTSSIILLFKNAAKKKWIDYEVYNKSIEIMK